MIGRIVATLALVAGLSLPPAAAGAGAREDAIAAVIDGQMQAFRAGDPAMAFDFASPMIRQMFGSSDNFGRMVATGFPPIWQPGTVRLLGLREEAGRLQQRVEVTDAAGRRHFFDYEMIETDAGWKINGVRPVAGVDVGV